MKLNKLTSLCLASAMILSGTIMLNAAELETKGVYERSDGIDLGESDIVVKVVEFDPILVATIPVEIPVVVDTKGVVTVPSSDVAKIINNSDQALEITKVDITESTDWKYRIWDFTDSETDKIIAFKVNGDGFERITQSHEEADGAFKLTGGKWSIPVDGELPLEIECRLSKAVYSAVKSSEVAGKLQFTIGFAE